MHSGIHLACCSALPCDRMEGMNICRGQGARRENREEGECQGPVALRGACAHRLGGTRCRRPKTQGTGSTTRRKLSMEGHTEFKEVTVELHFRYPRNPHGPPLVHTAL